jgi:exodeoxyribonuclease V
MITFSKKQQNVINSVLQWFKCNKYQYITLGGYAGTGKTTLLGHMCDLLHKEKKNLNIAFCSLTGKASRVLERKLRDTDSIYPTDYIGTIHRLIYRPIVDRKGNIVGWEKIPKEEFAYSLIVADEASMISQDIWIDLLSFEVPILAVGDHGQLPPIHGTFNLMKDPQLKLEDIFRQESTNPIIKVSEIARKEGTIPFKEYSQYVKKLKKEDINTQDILTNIFETYDNSTMVLCGYNTSRVNLNKSIRDLHFDKPTPQIGDRVICLKNNRNLNIYNGMTGTIQEIYEEKKNGFKYYNSQISLDYETEPFWGKVSIEQFNSCNLNDLHMEDMNYFDFGYAFTVHKAQGSEAKRVVVFEERFSKMNDDTYARWLYTAVTRAQEQLYIVS